MTRGALVKKKSAVEKVMALVNGIKFISAQ